MSAYVNWTNALTTDLPRAQLFGRAETFWSEHGYEPMQVSIFSEWGA